MKKKKTKAADFDSPIQEVSPKKPKKLKERSKSELSSKEQKKLERERQREAEIMAKKTPEEVAFFKQIKRVEAEMQNDERLKPVKKKKGLKALNDKLKNISIANLNKQIQGFGYELRVTDYMKNMGILFLGMIGASIFFGLKLIPILILALALLVAYPIITLAQYETVANNDDFEQIIAYLEQMIIAFKNNPKILLAMKASTDIVEGKMRDKVLEAIHLIETDSKSANVYEKAFNIIEDEYKCSRLGTLHRLIYTIEQENSVNYQDSLDNLYTDVREWQKRTYKLQAALSATKNQLTILLGASIGIAGLFAYLMRTVEHSVTFTNKAGEEYYPIQIISNNGYQVATLVFFLMFVIIYTLVNTKINGNWLVNDLENPRDKEIIEAMKRVALEDRETSRKNAIIAVVILSLPVFIFAAIKRSTLILVVAIAFAVFVLKASDMGKDKNKKKVLDALKQEFPLWMRDVAVNLKNRIVVRAVAESEELAAYVMKPFIRTFLANIEKDPSSIKPYMNFLGEYKAQELSTGIKTLYSIRTLSAEDSQRQVNDLIDRNQELLAESERIRHENSVAGVGFIGLLPMVLMSFLLMVYLVIMLMQFLALMGGTTS